MQNRIKLSFSITIPEMLDCRLASLKIKLNRECCYRKKKELNIRVICCDPDQSESVLGINIA